MYKANEIFKRNVENLLNSPYNTKGQNVRPKYKDGTEIGWFNAFNVGENDENSLLIVSMVENVKGKGGSHYLLPKVKEIFETY